MYRKIISVLVMVFILLSFVGCSSTKIQKNTKEFNTNAETSLPENTLIAQNSSYKLEWNVENNGIVLTDIKNGYVWGTSPANTDGEKLDDLGMPIKRHPQVESVLIVKYMDAESNAEGTAVSYNGAVRGGRVVCTAIENGIKAEYYFDNEKFMIPVSYKLLDNGVSVSIDPTQIQESDNKITKISLAPFWCSVENDSPNSYLFVPSGSGALIEPYTRSQQGSNFSGAVYGEDPAIEVETQVSTTEGIKLPVYGMKNDSIATCAIITSGADSAVIEATAGATTYGYSSVYSSFLVRGYTNHTAIMFGNQKVHNVVYADLMISTPLEVTFIPLVGENASYSGMANAYSNYLIKSGQMSDTSNSNRLNITVLGGTEIKKFFLGIPYTTVFPLTTLTQAEEIVSKLSKELKTEFSVNLKGFGSSGVDVGKIAGGYEISGKLGSVKQLNGFIERCEGEKAGLYFDFDLVRFSKSSNGYSTYFDSVTNAGENKAAQYFYDVAVKTKLEETRYYLLGRSHLYDAADKVLEKTSKWKLPGMAISTLSNTAYSDYIDKTDSTYYSKSGMASNVTKIVEKLKSADKKVMVSNANVYAAANADVIIDAPMTSSKNHLFSADVPFYEMVFRGYVSLNSPSINLSANPDRTILQAVESGCGLNYTVMYQWDESMLNEKEALYYGTVFDSVYSDIVSNTNKLSDYYDAIADSHIVSHKILDSGIRETVFDNGITVYVNYTDHALKSPIGDVNAHNYLIGGM